MLPVCLEAAVSQPGLGRRICFCEHYIRDEEKSKAVIQRLDTFLYSGKNLGPEAKFHGFFQALADSSAAGMTSNFREKSTTEKIINRHGIYKFN